MSNVVILRDQDEAQRFLLQSLWFQRTIPPQSTTVKPALDWAMEIAAGGQPLPPLGVVADFGYAAFGSDRSGTREQPTIPGVPAGMLRAYEDYVLGKLYADWTFERASDAMRRFQGRDRAKGLAYVVRQFRDRCRFGGVELSPGIIRAIAEMQPGEALRRGWDSLTNNGPMPLLLELFESLIAGARRMAEALASEDVIALEQRTALADMGQYVAHRQVVQIANRLEAGLPRQKVRPLAGRKEVPTRIFDEDTYPVGGFSSISTKGSVESLLHSQLAYMESDPDLRPDLFDVKFLRDELFYYSRDENQFLRRRRVFLFCLFPELVKTRFKDADLPVQRIVMVLGLLLTAYRKISEWLSTDALRFEFLLIQEGAGETRPLAHEGELLEMLFREQIESQIVGVKHVSIDLVKYADQLGNRNLCHVLTVNTAICEIQSETAISSSLAVSGPRPVIRLADNDPIEILGDDPFDCWTQTLERLLMAWV